MRYLYPFEPRIDLFVQGRIAREDAKRQERTAKEILQRLVSQPGVILADEVGMGKTFVALAVAVSVALRSRGRRPVVVMVPPSLKEKWPRDFELFLEKCIAPELRARLKWGRAERAVEFLKLLDDPPSRKKSILFVTHGAMSRGLSDGWVKLALIYQALRGRWDVAQQRRTISRFVGDLLHMKWVDRRAGCDVWEKLLARHPSTWLNVLHRWGVDPENDDNPDTDDDPVPSAVLDILPQMNLSSVYDCLQKVPKRKSKNTKQRIEAARKRLNAELRSVWKESVSSLKLKLPLLVLDEAHHLKNAQTRLASLFHVSDAEDDANEIHRGPLGGVFERMLFLTATPFQLGHHELCSVLDRFDGVCWKGKLAPKTEREGYIRQRHELREALDRAQQTALTLDHVWGRLKTEDLQVNGLDFSNSEAWWSAVRRADELAPAVTAVKRSYDSTRKAMIAAQDKLSPWVIRHLKPRSLPEPFAQTARRMRIVGKAINADEANGETDGLDVARRAILPFLLAARATTHAPKSRPVFAEGLASSYEAFLHTRLQRLGADGESATDYDDDPLAAGSGVSDAARWYLDHLDRAVPKGDVAASSSHPKVHATTQRALKLWRTGEKVVVFCHYIRTGRVLRQTISEAINRDILQAATKRLDCEPSEAADVLFKLGERFFDRESPLRRACDRQVDELLRPVKVLAKDREAIVEVVRRSLRTPSFLVRFFPIEDTELREEAFSQALAKCDASGMTLRNMLERFFDFLANRCGAEDRAHYIDAMSRIQTGAYRGAEAIEAYDPSELDGEQSDRLNPTVRLVNGSTKSETRQRLMLAFNTPFFPEVLIASAVMAEGVDLHLNCRYMVHHDLCWNPSTLEQRTGRIDRIGAKAEQAGKSIGVYLPYIAATQDEKIYRVVMDRERWFNVLMGEEYQTDAQTTDKLADRVAFPESAARELAFRLEVAERHGAELSESMATLSAGLEG